MAISDLMPPARPKKIDPKRIQEIREGSKKADQIREMAEQHHHEKDVPAAEAQLLADLENLDKKIKINENHY